MSFTYDLSTAIGKVRLIIADRLVDEKRFDDSDIQAFLDLYAGITPEWKQIKLAAAEAQETTATDQTLLLKVIRLRRLEVETNGPQVAADLRQHAARLRSDVLNNLPALAAQSSSGSVSVCTEGAMA